MALRELQNLLHRTVLGTPICVIVNAYSAGNSYAQEFRKRGYRCVHVQSRPELPPIFGGSFRPWDFIDNIIHDGDRAQTLERVRAYHPEVVVGGFEVGVDLADFLSDELGILTNGSALSATRRDKFAMANRLRECGVRSIPAKKCTDLESMLQWIAENTTYPVVLKPPDSAGSDGVTICATPDEVKRTFQYLMNRRNKLDVVDHEVVVETYFRGKEYMYNMASRDGVSRLTDCWRVKKGPANGKHFIYDYMEMLPSDGEEAHLLRPYAEQVLDAIGIRHGASHPEILVDEKGPILVEIAARLCGDMSTQNVIEACVGKNQVYWTVEAFTHPEQFKKEASTLYQLKTHARLMQLISTQDATIRSIPGLEKVKQLKSFHRAALRKQNFIAKTVDLYTSPGDIWLMHDDTAQVEADYERVREIEREGFFEVGPPQMIS